MSLRFQPAKITPDSRFVDNDYCFACGSRNPLGLHLSFTTRGSELRTSVTALPHWQGWEGVVHGGILTTIFDDLMSNHLFRLERVSAVTAELGVRFHDAVPVGEALVFVSHVVANNRRIWQVAATCHLRDNESRVLASAQGRFVQLAEL